MSKWQSLVREQRERRDGVRDRLIFSVVGLHALTVPQVQSPTLSLPLECAALTTVVFLQDPEKLMRERRDMFAVLLALGLHDPELDITLFHQDMVPQHAELGWYLNCVTPVGRLLRMTSWKVRLTCLVGFLFAQCSSSSVMIRANSPR